jgi:hypothetical protein
MKQLVALACAGIASLLVLATPSAGIKPAAKEKEQIPVPKLEKPPVIDGDLGEWKSIAFSDGLWDLTRLRHAPWYDTAINRLTDHGNEPDPVEDLEARYYLAWDNTYLYFGAEVRDNVNDVEDPQHEPKRWYFKDAVAWFLEAPCDQVSESFGSGDHAFCFVIDQTKPPYGAWWRHGTPEQNYIEEPIPESAVGYAIRMDPWKRGQGDFVLEARVAMALTLGKSDPLWHPPRVGDIYRLQIVHTDPDGGGYGGHFLLYGRGDDDATWSEMVLSGPLEPLERRPE